MKLNEDLKGSIGTDMLIKLGLAVIAAGVIIMIISPLISNAASQTQTCSAFQNWITDLSGAELC